MHTQAVLQNCFLHVPIGSFRMLSGSPNDLDTEKDRDNGASQHYYNIHMYTYLRGCSVSDPKDLKQDTEIIHTHTIEYEIVKTNRYTLRREYMYTTL